MGQLPTVEDVARVASVSRQTVSNVLNSPEIVKEATRIRVQSAIKELGYRRNASARRLRTQKSWTIGIRLDPILNGISGSVHDRFLHALTEKADERGMRILLFTANGPEGEIDQFRRLRDGADVDAFVLTATVRNDLRTAWLISNEVPFVTFGRPWGADDLNNPSHLWVDVDGYAGVSDATRRLAAEGAQRIGFIGWLPTPSGNGEDRRRGWSDAANLSEGELARLSVATHDTVPEGMAAANQLLSGALPPDAIVCASDSLALGALMAATAMGQASLPIVGYDNTPVAAALGLSSIDQPLADVAAAALELLFGEHGTNLVSHDAANEEPNHRLLAPRLVERRSAYLPLGETTGQAAGNHNRKESL